MKWIKCENPWSVAALMIANIALAVGARSYWYALLAGAFLLTHLLTGFRIPGPPRALFAILLMVPFGLWSREVLESSFTGWFPIDLLFLIGFYGVALGGYILTSAQTAAERHQALASALFSFALSGTAPYNPAFAPLLALFVPVLLLQVRRELGLRDAKGWQHQPMMRYVVALALLLVIWLGMQAVVSTSLSGLNRYMTQRMMSGGGGYVGYAHNMRVGLSQVLNIGPQGNSVMVRLWSDEPYEYLRGAVYDLYERGTWQIMEETRDVRPSATESAGSGRGLFNLTGVTPGERLAWVYPDRSMGHTYFLPLGTQVFAGYGRRALANEALAVRSFRGFASGGYELIGPLELNDEPGQRDLIVPTELRDELRQLALSITPDGDPPALRVQKIADYFAEHFTYQLGMKRQSDKDPILEFLQDQRTGHCEYFATAAVLLLRSIDIPARYVTGFVVREQAGDQLWLARAKDAHAWVEVAPVPGSVGNQASDVQPEVTGEMRAGDSRLGVNHGLRLVGRWATFDPTPPDGQPMTTPTEERNPWRDWLTAWWDRLASVTLVGGLGAVLAVMWESTLGLLTGMPWYVWLVMVVLGLMWVFRKSISQRLRVGTRERLSPHARAMRGKLRQAEKMARSFGVVRSPTDTVSAFQVQLREANLPEETRRKIDALLDEYQRQRFSRR